MKQEKTKKHNVGLTILKIFLIVVLCIVLLLVGGYFYLKNALGIDISKIKKGLDLLNKPYSTSAVVTSEFDKNDTEQGFIKLFGEENNVYSKQNNSINKTEFETSTIQDICQLNSNELAGIVNLYISSYLADDELGSSFLKQFSFSNLQKTEDNTQVDIIFTFEINIFKESAEDNFLSDILSKYIPKKILLTSNAKLTYPNDNCFNYSIQKNNFKINNLSYEQTEEVFDSFAFLGFNSEIVNELNNLLFSSIFGENDVDGVLTTINKVDTFDFLQIDDEIFFEIKKV